MSSRSDGYRRALIPMDLFGEVSTQDDGVRSAFDFYETPPFMTRSLLANHPIVGIGVGGVVLHPCLCGQNPREIDCIARATDSLNAGFYCRRGVAKEHRAPRVLECAAGRGAITRVLEAAGCLVVENDLNPAHGRKYQLDMTRRESWLEICDAEGGFDYVISNLPFVIAIDILRAGLDVPVLAFITVLLKSFDEPTEDRGLWLAEHPWTRKINQPRHKFRGEGSPSIASDWFVWERERRLDLSPCVVDHLAKSR